MEYHVTDHVRSALIAASEPWYTPQTMRILVVEDEQGIAKNIADFLRQHAFVVDTAFDGRTGLAMAEATPYDIILLDWMLPEIDGLEVCRALRKHAPAAAIILLTAKDTLDDKVLGLTTGADDYIVKPFELRELLARIQSLLRRKYANQPEGNILRVGDLTLDLSTQEVKRGEKHITLTRKLYQLLEFLMRNKNRVLPKAEIEAHLWDAHAELWSDVVRSHIQKLREKVDSEWETKLIRTVHGMGYRITDQPDET